MPKHQQILTIATRKSPLALLQTEIIKNHLLRLYPDLTIQVLPLSTEGDKRLGMPLATIGGKGLFVKELEEALLQKIADIAVHSSKDMPTVQPDGLEIAVFYERHDPRDALVSDKFNTLSELPEGAVVGTASLRRQCLLKSLRPDLTIKTLRGNVQTRLQKLKDGEFDAIVLAAAGLQRQSLQHLVKDYFDPEIFTPACTQGVLCIECRSEDAETKALLEPLHHSDSAICAIAERSMNLQLQGGCQVPIGGYAKIHHGQLQLKGLVGKPDGTLILRAEAESEQINSTSALQLGQHVANDLLDQGAGKILEEVYSHHG